MGAEGLRRGGGRCGILVINDQLVEQGEAEIDRNELCDYALQNPHAQAHYMSGQVGSHICLARQCVMAWLHLWVIAEVCRLLVFSSFVRRECP